MPCTLEYDDCLEAIDPLILHHGTGIIVLLKPLTNTADPASSGNGTIPEIQVHTTMPEKSASQKMTTTL